MAVAPNAVFKKIGLTQRVFEVPELKERRDCVDQRWIKLLHAIGYTPVLLPNHVSVAVDILRHTSLDGILFTGGNSLSNYGGDAPERDDTEMALLKIAIEERLPCLGVCRGMQLIQHAFGIELEVKHGHVATDHMVLDNTGNEIRIVNSYHRFGTNSTVDDIEVKAKSSDGVVEEIRHACLPIRGIMWHPERREPFDERDIQLLKDTFCGD
jgi:N5-(cytidine 5'-diphosphoramidyl)-L-glutamine hydrolase